MGFWEDRANAAARQVIVSHSRLDPLREYLNNPITPIGLTVTCGMDNHRAAILQDVVCRGLSAGWPVIVLYSDASSETAVQEMLPFIRTQNAWVRPGSRCYYGPLYGMTADQAKSIIIADREHIGSRASDALSDLLALLPQLGYAVHLDYLIWLASLEMSEMTQVLHASSLSQDRKIYYLNRFATYYPAQADGISPMARVRDCISDFSNTLINDLWCNDRCVDQVSILDTIARKGFLAIGVNKDANSGAMRYLARELTFACDAGTPFLLCCCDVTVADNSVLAQTLKNNKGRYSLFVSAKNMVSSFPGENNFWQQTLDLTGQLLVLNCSVPGSAKTYSELFGQYIRLMVTDSVGSTWAPFGIFPGRHRASNISEALFPRVTEQELTAHYRGGIFWPYGGTALQICDNLNLRSELRWEKKS